MSSNTILITLVSIGIGILLVTLILMINKRNKKDTVDNWEPHMSKEIMYDNGGIYNGIGEDSNPFQTKMACSCSGYGVKRKNNENMPFNDDSNLYNSPLQLPQNIREGFEVSNLPNGADCGVNREVCNRVCQSKTSHASSLMAGNNPDMPLLQSYQCGPQ